MVVKLMDAPASQASKKKKIGKDCNYWGMIGRRLFKSHCQRHH